MTAGIDYKGLQTIATNLITSLGAPYKLVRPSITGDTALGQTFGTFSTQVASLFNSTGGGIVISDKKIIYLPVIKSGKVEPQPEDRLISVTNKNISWRIVDVQVTRPDNITTIFYKVTIT